jgi:hypothetical protein
MSYEKTFNQILLDGHAIIENTNEEGKMKTRINGKITVWKERVKNRFVRLETYNQNLAL